MVNNERQVAVEKSTMKSFFLSILVFTVLTVSVSAQIQIISENDMLSKGDTLPEMILTTIDGESLKTEDLKGKVVFYNFYFKACAPCVAQKEGLNKLYEIFASDDVLFIAITFDKEADVRNFQREYKSLFKIVSISNKEIQQLFGPLPYPANILVGTDGKIAKCKFGCRTSDKDLATQDILAEFSPIIQSELQKLKSKK